VARRFERHGLGYVLRVPEIATEFAVSQVHRQRGDLMAEIVVSCGLPGVKAHEGRLHSGRMNLSSTTNRKTVASYIAERANVPDVDWRDLLEDFCSRVLASERKGKEPVRIGDRPRRIQPRYQVDPIMPWRKVTTFFGAGGTGKSTLAVAIGVSIQTGITVVPGWVPMTSNVLYLDWETDEDDLDEKIKAIVEGAGIDGAVTFTYLSCHGRPFIDQVEWISEVAQSIAAGFVVVDSVMHAAGTASSEGADAAETTIRLYSALARLEASVLLVDHVDKASANDPTKPAKPYGSIVKENSARQAFEVRRAEGAGDRSSLALYNTKTNLGRKLKPIGLWVDQTDDLVRYGREQVAGDLLRPLTIGDQIASMLGSGSQHVKVIAELLEVDEAKVRATLSKGKGRRFTSLGEGNWGLISHAG
jgi:Mrp family chromosome partitioning ATPase